MWRIRDRTDLARLAPLEARWQDIASEIPGFNLHTVACLHPGVWHMETDPKSVEFIAGLKSEWIRGWSGDQWFNFPLMICDTVVDRAAELCPKTVETLRNISGVNVAGFARMGPHSKLEIHADKVGPSFGSLAVNMQLTGEKSSLYLRQGRGCLRHLHCSGAAVVFNSELEHYADNLGDCDRVILYLDVSV